MSNSTVIQSSRQIPITTKYLGNQLLSNCVEILGLAKIQVHIFVYVDQKIANCGAKQVSLESWEYLKKRLLESKLDQSHHSCPKCMFRTKSQLLASFLF